MQERVEAVSQVLKFSEGRIPAAELQAVLDKEEQLKSAIIFAREYLKGTLPLLLPCYFGKLPFCCDFRL